MTPNPPTEAVEGLSASCGYARITPDTENTMRTCRKHNVRGIATYGDCPECLKETVPVTRHNDAVRDYLESQLDLYKYWSSAGPAGRGWMSWQQPPEDNKAGYEQIRDWLSAELGKHNVSDQATASARRC